MTAVLSIRDCENPVGVLQLVHTAIDAEIKRLDLAIQLASQKLAVYEQDYQVSSAYFMQSMTAEELKGGDDEYIVWSGEFKLYQKLLNKQHALQDIRYVAG